MRDIIPEIRRRGAELVIVGNGQPWQAAAFREELGLTAPDHAVPLLVDPALAAYRAAGLRHGVPATFSLRALVPLVRTLRAGFRQRGIQGDPWEVGGAFLVLPDGTVPWSHRSRDPADYARPAALLAALAAAGLGG